MDNGGAITTIYTSKVHIWQLLQEYMYMYIGMQNKYIRDGGRRETGQAQHAGERIKKGEHT